MENKTAPTKVGQICHKVNEDINIVYIIVEQPDEISFGDTITVVSLRDLQRNIHEPSNAERQIITKRDLIVISNSLVEYVASFNAD